MRQAFRQFRSYPLQSVLIVLAVALGVAVITMVAASLYSSRATSQEQQNQLWNRELRMQSKKDDWGAFYQGGKPIPVREVGLATDEKVTLTLDDLQNAKEAAPAVDYAYLSEWTTFSKSAEDGSTINLDVNSATADFVEAARLKVIKGSLPSETDYEEQRKVIVLSQRALEQIGLSEDVVGQTISLVDMEGENEYTVLGIFEKPAQDFGGQESNSLVPYAPPPWDGGNPRTLLFAVNDPNNVDAARDQLVAFARTTWGERISVSSNQWGDDRQLRLMNVVIAAFASTALVAASLNIMNLMLARVLKRSHDIGIQRSLGETANTIVWRFLSESLVLGILGGLLGIAAGYGLHRVYENYQKTFYGEQAGFVATGFSPLAALIGFAVALTMSVLFGLYPAIRASRLRIIEALRGA
jgi:putative ABC transport system permease protein